MYAKPRGGVSDVEANRKVSTAGGRTRQIVEVSTELDMALSLIVDPRRPFG
jgi:hypothetical protein